MRATHRRMIWPLFSRTSSGMFVQRLAQSGKNGLPFFIQTRIIAQGVHLKLGPPAMIGLKKKPPTTQYFLTKNGAGYRQIDQIDVATDAFSQLQPCFKQLRCRDRQPWQNSEIQVTVRTGTAGSDRTEDIRGDWIEA